MKLLFYYLKQIAKYNIIVSLFGTAGFIGFLFFSPQQLSLGMVFSILETFFSIYILPGFLFAVFLYHYYRRNEYPMYYNKGFRPWQCIIITYIIHFSIASFFYLTIITLKSMKLTKLFIITVIS